MRTSWSKWGRSGESCWSYSHWRQGRAFSIILINSMMNYKEIFKAKAMFYLASAFLNFRQPIKTFIKEPYQRYQPWVAKKTKLRNVTNFNTVILQHRTTCCSRGSNLRNVRMRVPGIIQPVRWCQTCGKHVVLICECVSRYQPARQAVSNMW
jgi:hypothetical protein